MIPHIKPHTWTQDADPDEYLLYDQVLTFMRHNRPALNPITLDLLATDYTNFVIEASAKFEAGQKEHGGKITDRDLNKERQQEILDLFHYNCAEKWPNHLR